jgi:hypothetical protein
MKQVSIESIVRSVLPVTQVRRNAWQNKYRPNQHRLKFIIPRTAFSTAMDRRAAQKKIAKKLQRAGIQSGSAEFIPAKQENRLSYLWQGSHYFAVQVAE